MKIKLRTFSIKEAVFWAVMLSCIILLSTTAFGQEKPGPTNTGYSGTLTSASVGTISVDGTVIENVSTGSIRVQANNVTIRNCRISGGIYGIQCTYGFTGLVIEDCEILNFSSAGVYGANFTIRRCNIHDSDNDGLKPTSSCLVESNWIHNLGKADGSHADGVQTRQGGSNMTFRYNNFDIPISAPAPYKSNSAFIIEQDGGPITNVLIEYNWMNGGNYTIYDETPSEVNVRNNWFGRDYRYGIMNGVEVHTCNVWEDTGEAIDACSSNPTVATPVINPSSGTFSDPTSVSISCSTSGADIYYTIDGSDPSQSSILYTGPFTVDVTTTVKARGYATDMTASSTAIASIVILDGENIALEQPVSESAYQNESPNIWPGSYITDGNTSDDSRWSASGFPQWAEIDLGANSDISGIHVYTYQGRAYQYIVEGSTDGTNYATIIDRSSNTSGAQPIADNVTANARYVKITVTGASGYTGSWVSLTEVMVMGEGGTVVAPISVSVAPTTLNLDEGQSADLTETVLPSNATDKTVSWSSSNTAIATVDANGLVSAVSEGSAVISVESNYDSQLSATCAVTVNDVPIPTGGYYCDPVNGSMSNDGSQSAPWSTLEDVFSAGKTFAAGDVIYLMNGHHGSPIISGSNSGQVIVEALSGHSPTMKSVDFESASNWTISGVKISPETAPSYSKLNLVDINSSTNIIVDNCVIQSVQNPWTTASAWLSNYCMGVVLNGDYNTVSNCQIRNIDFGFLMGNGADHNLISNNLIENIGGDGIQSQGSYNTFENNVIRNCYNVDDNHDDCLQVYTRGTDGTVGDGNSIGVIIRGNTFISTTDPNQPLKGDFQGVGGFDGMYTDWLIENNVIVTNHWHGIALYGAVNCTVINNTVVDASDVSPGPLWIKLTAHKDGTPATGNIVRNNLCTDMTNDANVGIVENNIIVSYSEYGTYFTDFSNNDLSLKAGCNAIDAGTATGAPSVDILGNPRPQGSGYDVGAYEYSGVFVDETSVSVSPSTISIEVGYIGSLTATVLPENASNKSVTWTTSNAAVATVDASGVVSALSEGIATITATTNNLGLASNCIVTVLPPSGDYNLALSMPVTVTAEQTPDNIGSKLVDNIADDASRWSADGFPQSATIDLGEECNITRLEAYTYLARAYQYTIEVSVDGSTFTQIVDRSSNTSTSQPIADNVSETGRYVKLTVTGAADYTGTWVSITELKVIGNKNIAPIDPTDISVSPTSLDLEAGQAAQLTETVLPSNATDKSVTWSSSDPAIASVDANGLVSAVGGGSAIVTVETVNGLSATCNVSVTVPPTSVSLSETSIEIYVGDTYDLDETVLPTGATDKSVSWSSDDTSVAAVDANGVVSALSEGQANITVTTNVAGLEAMCNVTVLPLPSQYIIDEDFSAGASDFTVVAGGMWAVSNGRYVLSSPGDAAVGLLGNISVHNTDVAGDFELSTLINITSTTSAWNDAAVIINYQDANNYYYISLNESNDGNTKGILKVENGATTELADITASISDDTDYTLEISKTGNVIVVELDGTEVASAIDATFTGGKVGYGTKNDGAQYDNLLVSVNGPVVIDPESISLNQATLTLDEGISAQLSATVLPEDATDKNVTWTTSNSSIASVSDGLVSALNAGIATITATTVNGLTATCQVTVTVPVIDPTSISLDQSSLTLDEGQAAQLIATVLPTDATDKSVTWSTSNSGIATVSNGLVSTVNNGSATITATTVNGLTASCTVTVNEPPATWDVITYDDFEGGFGNFKDGGGDCYLYTGGTYAHQGSNAGQIQDNQDVYSTFYYTNSVDLSSYSQLKIEFWFYGLGMNDGHDFFVEYSDNGGSTWQSIAQYIQGAGNDFVNGQFYEVAEGGDFSAVVIDNSSYNFTSNVKIRFRCDGLQNDDQVYIDEISVTATTASAKQLTKPVSVDSQSQLSVEAYPNPCIGELNLVISGGENASLVQLIDVSGKVVYVQQLPPLKALYHLSIETSMLKNGMYILSVSQGGSSLQQKLIIRY